MSANCRAILGLFLSTFNWWALIQFNFFSCVKWLNPNQLLGTWGQLDLIFFWMTVSISCRDDPGPLETDRNHNSSNNNCSPIVDRLASSYDQIFPIVQLTWKKLYKFMLSILMRTFGCNLADPIKIIQRPSSTQPRIWPKEEVSKKVQVTSSANIRPILILHWQCCWSVFMSFD